MTRPYKEKIKKLEKEVEEKQKEIDQLKIKLFQKNALNKNNRQFMNNMGDQINNQLMNNQFNNMNQMNMRNNMGIQGNMMNNPMSLMNNQFNQNNMMNMPNFPLNNNPMDNPMFQMCNLMNPNNINSTIQIGNNNNKKEVKFLSICFRMKDEGATIMIQCRSDEKMEDTINKFCCKAFVKKEDYKFIFNAKNVIFDSTVEQNGLTDNSNILVVKKSQSEALPREKVNIINNDSVLGEEICLFFSIVPHGFKVALKIGINNTVREAEYKICQSFDIPISTLKYLKFIFIALELNPNMTIKQSGLKNGSEITVVDTQAIIGA